LLRSFVRGPFDADDVLVAELALSRLPLAVRREGMRFRGCTPPPEGPTTLRGHTRADRGCCATAVFSRYCEPSVTPPPRIMRKLHRCRRVAVALGFLLTLCLPLAAAGAVDTAVLHARLERSTPAADDTLGVRLDSVRLEFSGNVSADLTRLLLVGPAGDTTALSPASLPGNRRIIVAEVPALRAGSHVLHWRTTSSD